MQLNPLNSNHLIAQDTNLQNVVKSSAATQRVEDENLLVVDPSRIEKIFNTLTRELSEREKEDREVALYKSMNPNYLQEQIPPYESEVVRKKIEEEKQLLAQKPKESQKEQKRSEEEFVENNDAINAQNRFELRSFVNDFYTLYDSGYTPIDLKI